MYTVTVTARFSAAHRLREYQGNCERLHGHNWEVRLTAVAEQVDASGMVVDFRELRELLRNTVAPFDHTVLNETSPFDRINPTAENVARHVFDAVKQAGMTGTARILRVSVAESEGSWASYAPGSHRFEDGKM